MRHGDGECGLPAIEYTRTHPDRVRRLVMSNAVHSAQAWQLGNIDSVNHEIRTRYFAEVAAFLAP